MPAVPSTLWITINAKLRPLDRGDLYAGILAQSPLARRCRVVPLPTTLPER